MERLKSRRLEPPAAAAPAPGSDRELPASTDLVPAGRRSASPPDVIVAAGHRRSGSADSGSSNAPRGFAPRDRLRRPSVAPAPHANEAWSLMLYGLGATLGRELRGQIWQHREVVALRGALVIAGYVVPTGIALQAGFQNLQPNPVQPFNPAGGFHRTLGAALVAYGPLTGLLGAVTLPTVAEPLVRLVRRRRPAPDCDVPYPGLLTEVERHLGQALVRHWLAILLVALPIVAGTIIPPSLAQQACFNQILPLPARPFNPHGLDLGQQASALCAWASGIGFGGTVVGAAVGVALYRLSRLLSGGPAPGEAAAQHS